MDFYDKLGKSIVKAIIINTIIVILMTVLLQKAGLFLAIIGSVPTFVLLTIWFMYKDMKKDRRGNKKVVEPKEPLSEFDYLMKSTKNKVVKIKKCSDAINNDLLKKEVNEFVIKTNKVVEICEEEDLQNISKFFTFCIPTVLESLEECYRYHKLNIKSDEVKSYRDKIISTLKNMNKVVDEVENACIKRRTDDVELELNTLETLFEVDGFMKYEEKKDNE